MKQPNYYRGLIIVYPHGHYIADGSKTLIIKSKKFESILNKPLLLIQQKEALGIIYLGNIKEITLVEFKKEKKQHQITEEERLKWWPDKKIFYEYNIEKKYIFAAPVLIRYPQGPQIVVKPYNVKAIQKIYIGTSGYYYDWWKPYYKDIKKREKITTGNLLAIYTTQFNSLEINGTFYRSFKKSVWLKLKNLVDSKFMFSAKVNRSITLYRKFNEFKRFWDDAKYLYPKLGCLLFQFPNNFKYSAENVRLLQGLNTEIRAAFEFRDKSWFREDVYNLFKQKHKWSMVISYIKNWPDKYKNLLDDGYNPKLTEWENTSDFIYIRMHGTTGRYTGSHIHLIPGLIKFIRGHSEIKHVFIYFNNTDSGKNMPDAIRDAKYLQKRIGF